MFQSLSQRQELIHGASQLRGHQQLLLRPTQQGVQQHDATGHIRGLRVEPRPGSGPEDLQRRLARGAGKTMGKNGGTLGKMWGKCGENDKIVTL